MKFSIRTLLIVTFLVALAVILVPKYLAVPASEISSAWIDFPYGTRFILKQSQFDEMETLVNSLVQIGPGISGKLDDDDAIKLNYQSGMDHTCVLVDYDGDRLLVSKGNSVYFAGEAKPFYDKLNALVDTGLQHKINQIP